MLNKIRLFAFFPVIFISEMVNFVVAGALPQKLALTSPPPHLILRNDAPLPSIVPPSLFTANGIIFGNKSLRWHNAVSLELNERESLRFLFYAHTEASTYVPMNRISNDIDKTAKSMVGKQKFPLNKKPDEGTFTQTVKQLDSTRAEICFDWACPGESRQDFKKITPVIIIPRNVAQGKTLVFDEDTVILPDDENWGDAKSVGMKGVSQCRQIIFNLQSPKHGFKIEFPEGRRLSVSRTRSEIWITILTEDGEKFTSHNGTVRLIIDFWDAIITSNDSADSVVAGINFTSCDNLNVPVFDAKSNLLINPSFESGLRYWTSGAQQGWFNDLEYMITEKDAKFGKKSLLLEGRNIHMMTIPTYMNRPYTLSFYAKSISGKKQTVILQRREFGFAKRTNISIAGENWKRYSHTFTTKEAAVKLSLLDGDGVLLDGVQLEQSDTATPYCGNQMGLELVNDSPDGFMDADKSYNMKLVVRAPAGTTGQLQVVITDFFYRNRLEQSFRFQVEANGETFIPLPLNELTDAGPFVMRVDVQPDKLPHYTDFLRFFRIKKIDNNKKNKNIQALCSGFVYDINTQAYVNSSKGLEFLRYAGIGAITGSHIKPTEEAYNKFKKNNLEWTRLGFVAVRRRPVSPGSKELKRQAFIDWNSSFENPVPIKYNGVSLLEISKSSPGLEKQIEEAACDLVKKYPYIKLWSFTGEPTGRFAVLNENNYDDYARWTAAFYRGVKRGNPEAGAMCNSGPSNMESIGINELARELDSCAKVSPEIRYDAMGIHPYRPFPERPDFDNDFLTFTNMLKQRGYEDTPIYFNEGGYFYPLYVPAWHGIAPWASTGVKDFFRQLLTPSYDMGWGERVCAAMLMRHWLVCYKYMDRVYLSSPYPPLFLDDTTPYAWLFMSGALSEILGNSTFKKDIRFARDARAYVFEDAQQRPVAAIWRWTESLDQGREQATPMLVDLKQVQPSFIDMLGNMVTISQTTGKYNLPLSNFPFYIRGEKGELNRLCEAIENAVVSSQEFPLIISTKSELLNQIKVQITNPLSRPFHGQVALGKEVFQPLTLNSMETSHFTVPLPEAIPFNDLQKIPFLVKIKDQAEVQFSQEFSFHAFAAKKTEKDAIVIDAQTDDWRNIPAISLKTMAIAQRNASTKIAEADMIKDFSASYRVAWNEDALYLLVEVNDPHFVNDLAWPVNQRYQNDAIQLFFDTLRDAPGKAKEGNWGFDTNDYSYELLPENENSAIAYRRFTVDHQYLGGAVRGLPENVIEPEVEVAFRFDGAKQIYEARFPSFFIRPFELKAGNSAGFGMMIYNRDEKNSTSHRILMNTPSSAYKRPDIYPELLLSE